MRRILHQQGFTLIELIVVIAIIGILATIVYANLGGTSASGRDTKRKADLRNMQTAIEAYKQKNGRYPAGCNTGWSGGTYSCPSGNQYIVGLAPEFISRLPFDPKLPASGQSGYVYVSNTDGTVYKLMAMNTVESETVTYDNEFKSCDMGTVNKPPELTGATSRVMCGQVISESNNTPNRCQESNARFKKSYAVWGGWAEKTTTSNAFTAPGSTLDLTQRIVCK